MYRKIKDSTFIKDTNSRAIINTDMSSLESYRRARENKRKQKNEFELMKQDIKEIKELLQKLVGNN